MPMPTIYVSVANSFRPGMTISEVADIAYGNWARNLDPVRDVKRLVAVYEGKPIAAWQVRGAYHVGETWTHSGQQKPRVAFSLGEPLPITSDIATLPWPMRMGSVLDEG